MLLPHSSSPLSWGDSDSDDEGEVLDDLENAISQHDPTQESIGAPEPAPPPGSGDTSGDALSERMEAPLSQLPPNLEFEEFGPEQEVEEPGPLTLPRSESQDVGWGDGTDSEDGWDEEEDDDEDFPRSQGGGDAALYSYEQTKATLSQPVREAFEPMLAAEGPSRANKRQRSDAGLYSGAFVAYNHDCAAQRALRAAGGPKVNVACDAEWQTNSRRGHMLKLFCSACKARMVELRVGDVLRVNGALAMVCKLGNTMHLQKLSTTLRMHAGSRCAAGKGPAELRLLKMGGGRVPTFMLTRQHLHLDIGELNTAWTQGKVEWMASAAASAIMFCRSATTNDVESVDFSTAPVSECGCYNPWAVKKALNIRPGDLVELVPGKEAQRMDGVQVVDKRTRLGRVLGWELKKEKKEDDKENARPGSGGSSGSGSGSGHGGSSRKSGSVGTGGSWNYASQPTCGSQHRCRIAVRLLDLHISDPKLSPDTAYTFKSSAVWFVPQKHIIRRLDPDFDLPREVVLVENDAEDAPSPSKLPPPLQCIDLFAGMGGLSLGLEASGAARVGWAVDAYRAAVETYRASHADARVSCDDVCKFLEKLGTRDFYPPKWNEQADKAAATRGDPLTLLVGGPPCQGFSGASKADMATRLKKNICLAVFLEAVKRIMPHYVIIENVKGMLRAEGAVEGVFHVLVSLGYQVRLRVLNAGAYGVAQHRVRTIIMAARHNLPLPQAPHQTHIFAAGGYDAGEFRGLCDPEKRLKCALSGVPVRWQPCVEVWNCAFLPRVDVWQCMFDLPHQEGEHVRYKSPPRCPYQASMRDGIDADALVLNHVTNVRNLKQETRDRLDAVPRERDPAGPGRILGCADPQCPPQAGDFRDIPREKLPDELQDEEAWNLRRNWGRMGRLFWWSQFRTLLTKSCIRINSRTAGPVLHPEAARPLTVREAARVMGIPDIRIHGGLADGYKQCGNGVPPPLAQALGRELRRAEWMRLQRQQT